MSQYDTNLVSLYMYTELLAQTPEEKLKNYAEVNNVDLPSGYVNFVPNDHVTTSLDFMNKVPQQVDIKSTLDKKVKPPVILSQTKVKANGPEAKITEEPSKIFSLTSESIVNSPTKVVPAKAAREAYNYYVTEHKLPAHVAAGIVGNLYQESGLDPLRKENNGGNGRGIAQWDVRDRWPAMQKWAKAHGKDPNDMRTQLDYILVEPGEEGAIKRTLSARDTTEATMTFGKYYERPNAAAANWDHRTNIAKLLANLSI